MRHRWLANFGRRGGCGAIRLRTQVVHVARCDAEVGVSGPGAHSRQIDACGDPDADRSVAEVVHRPATRLVRPVQLTGEAASVHRRHQQVTGRTTFHPRPQERKSRCCHRDVTPSPGRCPYVCSHIRGAADRRARRPRHPPVGLQMSVAHASVHPMERPPTPDYSMLVVNCGELSHQKRLDPRRAPCW